jgi:hypothetical protein
MGCWNNTCMISNLPIISGEKVKLVILGNNYAEESIIGRSGYCYSNGMLSPLFLPISGTYNDYGGIEHVVQDFNYNIISESLHKQFGNTIKVDRDDVKENWTLEDFLDGIERGCCDRMVYQGKKTKEFKDAIEEIESLKDIIDEKEKSIKVKALIKSVGEPINDELMWLPVNISWVMIREDIWNEVIKITNSTTDIWSSKNKYGLYLNQEFEGWIQQLNEINDPDIDQHEKMMRIIRSSMDDNRLFSLPEGGGNLNKISYTEYCKTILDNSDLLEDFKIQLLEFKTICKFLEASRKGWMIQPGQGSQHHGWEEHKKLAQSIINICDAKIKEYEYEEDDDEE